MFRFNQLEQIHLEITNNCQASCPMCSRNFHGGMNNPLIRVQEWSFNDFKKIINQEVLDQIKSIFFCGNFGDPLLNDDLIQMCQYVKENSDVSVRIHTNGSLRNRTWWKSLAEALPKEHVVIFGIDGLEDTHSRYRIGTDYEKIIQNANTFINSGGIAEWAFIVFQHNEHQVERAREVAKEVGFERFTVKNSSRFFGESTFPVYDSQGNTIDELKPSSNTVIKFLDKSALKNFQHIVDESTIDCYALKNKEVYIDAHKNLMPCCFLASIPYNYNPAGSFLFELKKQVLEQYNSLLEDLKNIDVVDRSIKEIVDSVEYQTVWEKYWTIKKLMVCVRTCGKNQYSKPMDQFIKREDLTNG